MLVIGRYSCAGDTGTPPPDIVLPWIVLLMRTIGFFAGGLCSQLGEGLMGARHVSDLRPPSTWKGNGKQPSHLGGVSVF